MPVRTPAKNNQGGAPLLEVLPLLPPTGNLTLVVAAPSYAGQLNLIAAADRDSCPDIEVFTTASAPPSTTSPGRRLRPPLEQDLRGHGGAGVA